MEPLGLRALCYVRPWTESYFRYVSQGVFGSGNTMHVSDFRGLGSPSIADLFYGHLRRQREPHWPDFISREERDDLVARCRLLRELAPEEADQLLAAMTWAIEEVLDRCQPQIIFAPLLDSYVMDLLRVCAARRGVPFLGLSPTFMSGYCRLTARGEHVAFRRPKGRECRHALQELLDPQYQPPHFRAFSDRGSWFLIQRWLRENVKQAYFTLLPWLRRDPLNYHYATSRRAARQRSRWDCLGPARFFDSDWQERLQRFPGGWAYVPLHFHPEATTDYWLKPRDFLDYEESVLEVARRLAAELPLAVKEHPAFLGFRSAGFYRRLRSIPNLVVVPAGVRSNQLVETSVAVVVWLGSVGAEAGLRGKAVVTLGQPYYATGLKFLNVTSRQELDQVPAQVRRLAATPAPTADEKLVVIRHVLSGCVPGSYDGLHFSASNATKKAKADGMIASLRRYLPRWRERVSIEARTGTVLTEPEFRAADSSSQ
ncbi:MAG: hypothetical protein ACRD2Q_10460 [Terriglobales bacterium]